MGISHSLNSGNFLQNYYLPTLTEMEAMYKMMKTVFDTFELGNKSISLTNSGQCRLSAIGACVNDVRIKVVGIAQMFLSR